MPELKDFFSQSPTIIILALILWRGLPTWKEVRMRQLDLQFRDLDVRQEENKVRGHEAVALGQLADVLGKVAIEQRRATETIEILQRMNTDTAEALGDQVDELNISVNRLSENVGQLNTRVEQVEKKNEKRD